MFEEGYANITNIDISNVCVKAMKEKYGQKGDHFKYLLMDVKAMDFPESSFDAVVDKATLDSVLVTLVLSSVEKIQLPMPTR
jgi:ubiquinone/menaquinone biosynthesis C-methylase UbiE